MMALLLAAQIVTASVPAGVLVWNGPPLTPAEANRTATWNALIAASIAAHADRGRPGGAAARARAGRRGVGSARKAGETTKAKRIQIVGRIPAELSRRVRAAAKQQHCTLNAFLIAALTRAVSERKGA